MMKTIKTSTAMILAGHQVVHLQKGMGVMARAMETGGGLRPLLLRVQDIVDVKKAFDTSDTHDGNDEYTPQEIARIQEQEEEDKRR